MSTTLPSIRAGNRRRPSPLSRVASDHGDGAGGRSVFQLTATSAEARVVVVPSPPPSSRRQQHSSRKQRRGGGDGGGGASPLSSAQSQRTALRKQAEENQRLVAETRALNDWQSLFSSVMGVDGDISAADARRVMKERQREADRERRARNRRTTAPHGTSSRGTRPVPAPPHTARPSVGGGGGGLNSTVSDLGSTLGGGGSRGATAATTTGGRFPLIPASKAVSSARTGTAATTTAASAGLSGTARRHRRKGDESPVLPALGTSVHKYIPEALDGYRSNPETHEAFMDNLRRDTQHMCAGLRENAMEGVREAAAMARDGSERKKRAAQHSDHQRAVQHRRRQNLDDAKQKVLQKHEAFEQRQAAAEEARLLHEERQERTRQWRAIVVLIVASSQLGRVSSAALLRMRVRWRQIFPICVGGYWIARARAAIRRREELQANAILGKKLPDALLRIRRRMYGSHADLLVRFVRDVAVTQHFPRVVAAYLQNLRRAQRMMRHFLAGRRLWHAAMQLSWERAVQENVLAQYNASFPRDALAPEITGVGSKASPVVLTLEDDYLASSVSAGSPLSPHTPSSIPWDSRLPRPQVIVDALIHAMLHQRTVAQEAVKAHGVHLIDDGTVCKNPGAPKGGAQGSQAGGGGPKSADTVIHFVPRWLRTRVIRTVIAATAHQHSRRLIRYEQLVTDESQQHQQQPRSPNAARGSPTTPGAPLAFKKGSPTSPHTPAGGSKLVRPRLHRHVDRRTMRRLIHLVETKLAQEVAARDIVMEEDRQREAARHADFSEAMALTTTLNKVSSGGSSDLHLSATAAYDELVSEAAAQEMALHAPSLDISPNRGDTTLARDVIDAIIKGHAPAFAPGPSPVTASPNHDGGAFSSQPSLAGGGGDNAARQSTQTWLSPEGSMTNECADRRRRLCAMAEAFPRDGRVPRDDRAPMAMRDAAAELHDAAADMIVPDTLTFAKHFAEAY